MAALKTHPGLRFEGQKKNPSNFLNVFYSKAESRDLVMSE